MPLPDTLLLGFDSLVAGLAVAPLLPGASYRLAAAALFGAADAAASTLGMLIAIPLHGLAVAAPAVPALYGAWLIAATHLAGRGLRAASAATPRSRVAGGHGLTLLVLGALALALCVDNLAAATAARDASVVAMGCASAALMLLGLTAGGRISAGLSCTQRRGWIGVGLMSAACLAVLS